MANDNQTALQQSIQRKKALISNLEFERSKFPAGSTGSLHRTTKIKVLRDEIAEDEKLLAVDREQLMESFNAGRELEDLPIGGIRSYHQEFQYSDATEFLNEKYGTYETT